MAMKDLVNFGNLPGGQFLDARYVIDPRELVKIDREVRGVLRDNPVGYDMFPKVKIPKGQDEYEVGYSKDGLKPVFDPQFRTYQPDIEGLETEKFYLIAFHKDYYIGMKTLDAAQNSQYFRPNVKIRTLQEFAAMMVDWRDRVVWNGDNVRDANPAATIDDNFVGIMDTTGIQTLAAGSIGIDGGADMTVTGDGDHTITNAISALILEKFKPPYDLVTTPGLFAQLLKNKTAVTRESDMKLIKQLGIDDKGKPYIRSIKFTPHLINAVETNTTAAFVLLATNDPKGKNVVEIAESYPLWHYPMKEAYQLGITGKLLTELTACVIRPKGVIKGVDITINTIPV